MHSLLCNWIHLLRVSNYYQLVKGYQVVLLYLNTKTPLLFNTPFVLSITCFTPVAANLKALTSKLGSFLQHAYLQLYLISKLFHGFGGGVGGTELPTLVSFPQRVQLSPHTQTHTEMHTTYLLCRYWHQCGCVFKCVFFFSHMTPPPPPILIRRNSHIFQ